ncbi:MAG: hypothetical protein DRJ03_18915 [Chloroflexi bacterium]|nr:MAG: hypothetical protein DRJ03_18915 [Chloroflexota bacterium]
MRKQSLSNVFVEQFRNPVSFKSLAEPVVHGFVWLNGMALLSAVLSFIQTIIIARVLEPYLVGLVAVFYIIQGALDSFTATGFKKAVIQRKEISQEYVDTAFVTHLVRGMLLAAIVLLSAPFLVRMLGVPEAQYVVQAMAFSILLQGARNPGALFFLRQLTFYKQFIWHASGALVRFVTTVVLLYIMENEWAIVYGVLAYEFAMLFLSYVLIDIRPAFRWDRKVFHELFNYGKWVLLASIAAFIERQGTQIGTVKLLGEASLGVLFLGLRIANMPTLVTQQLKNTLFPVFSRLQNSLEKTKRLYQRSLGALALFMFPIVGCAFVFAEPFTRLFLKASWAQVAEILGLLIFGRAFQSLSSVGIALLNAKGMPKFAFFNRLIQGVIIILGIYPLAKGFGLLGIAILYTVIGVASFVFSSTMVFYYLRFELAMLRVLLAPVVATTVTSFIFSYLVQSVFVIDSIPLFCGTSVVFFVVYFVLIFTWDTVNGKRDRTLSIPLTLKMVKEAIINIKR